MLANQASSAQGWMEEKWVVIEHLLCPRHWIKHFCTAELISFAEANTELYFLPSEMLQVWGCHSQGGPSPPTDFSPCQLSGSVTQHLWECIRDGEKTSHKTLNFQMDQKEARMLSSGRKLFDFLSCFSMMENSRSQGWGALPFPPSWELREVPWLGVNRVTGVSMKAEFSLEKEPERRWSPSLIHQTKQIVGVRVTL